MPIKTACPYCDKDYNLADEMSGKQVRCQNCETPFYVKGGAEEEVPVCELADEGASRKQSRPSAWNNRDEGDRVRRRKKDRVEEDEGTKPRKKPKSKSRTGLVIGLVAGGVGLLLGGVIVTVVLMMGSKPKFTVEGFNKIRNGMTEKEVLALVGDPDQIVGIDFGFAPKVMFWNNIEGQFSVSMFGGRVTRISAPGKNGNGGINLGGVDFPPINFPGMQKQDWNKLQIGMTEQQVIAQFGQPAQNHTYEGVHVTHAHVKMQEVMGPDGRTRPVKLFVYFKGFGEMGFVDVTFVDGKVFKFQK